MGKLVPIEKLPFCHLREHPNKIFQLPTTGGLRFHVLGYFLPAVGANVEVADRTIGGHRSEWENWSPKKKLPFCHLREHPNKIFQLPTTGGLLFQVLGYYCLQWRPMWRWLTGLLEAIGLSGKVSPQRKNFPFAT